MQYIYIIAKLNSSSARSNKLLFNYFLTSMAQIEGFSYISQAKLTVFYISKFTYGIIDIDCTLYIVYPPVN